MSDNDELDRLINKLVHATDPEEVKALYRQWADSYDDDLDTFGYVAPQIGTALFSQLVDKKANIHDAGCGTGQVGKLLTAHGYASIDGSDFSEDMLEQAKATDCYQQLLQLDYSGPVDLPGNTYDAVISIGVYTKRFKQHFLNEMLRIIKPGGHMLFSCRPVYFEEVAELVKQLHLDGAIDRSSVVDDDYMIGQKARAFYVTLTKTA
jgi:predicted TPR repeat methyltransferase